MPHFHALGTRFRVSADRYGAGRQSDARLGLEANAAPARAGGLCVPVPVPVPRPLAPYGRLLNLPDCFRVRAPRRCRSSCRHRPSRARAHGQSDTSLVCHLLLPGLTSGSQLFKLERHRQDFLSASLNTSKIMDEGWMVCSASLNTQF